MESAPTWLPEMIDVNGVWQEIIASLYRVFERDIKSGQLRFEGRPVWYDRKIEAGDAYEEGFWHLIARDTWNIREGRKIKERLFDPRRAERLPWCAPTIAHSSDCAVVVWDYMEAEGNIRTYVWLEQFDYAVILQKKTMTRGEVAFIITAFYIDEESKRRDLRHKHSKRCA